MPSRYQYKLRTMLLVVSVCAVVCLSIRWRVQQRRQQWLRDSIPACARIVARSPPIGGEVTTVDFVGYYDDDTRRRNASGVNDATIYIIAQITTVEELYLDDTAITDRSLSDIQRMPSLVVLSLRNTHITDTGIHKLVDMKSLKRLDLRGTTMSRSTQLEIRRRLPRCRIEMDE